MIELYLFFALLTIAILIIFNLFFLKNNWIKFAAKFKHNGIIANFISPSGKIKSYLKTPVDGKFTHKDGTYLIDEDKSYFEYPSRTPIYYYFLESSEPVKFKSGQDTINPGFLDDLLLAAKAAGSVDWISKLMKFKWIIVSFIVMAAGVAFLVWKMNEMEVALNAIQNTLSSIKSANLVG